MSDNTEREMQELRQLVRELMLEVGSLKDKVGQLEWRLGEAAAAPAAPAPARKRHAAAAPDVTAVRQHYIALQGESYEQLGLLYDEGYHICHMAFAEPRSGECLFCLSLLHKG